METFRDELLAELPCDVLPSPEDANVFADFLEGKVKAAQDLVPRAASLLSSLAAAGHMIEYPLWTFGGTHAQKVS